PSQDPAATGAGRPGGGCDWLPGVDQRRIRRMIFVDLPPGTTLFRALTPQWASRPTSGAGAAANGGRFNRERIEALYFSLDEVTALREYQQTSPFLPPCTMCSYTVALRNLVDLRQLRRGEPWDEL